MNFPLTKMAATNVTCFRLVGCFSENSLNLSKWTKNSLKFKSLFGIQSQSCKYVSTSEGVKTEGTKDDSEEVLTETEKKLRLDLSNIQKEVEVLNDKIITLEDKYKRSLADGENMRLRFLKQIEDAKLFGIQGFCKDLLEVSDILQRATESVPKEELTDENPHLRNLYEGLTMTDAQLLSVFKRHGLVPVNPLNEKFNPNLHEALFQQECEDKEAGTVIAVSKIGYKLHERVVRPALVGVSKR